MSAGFLERFAEWARLLRLSATLVAGRRFWIMIFVPLGWIAFQVFSVLVEWREEGYSPEHAQNVLIGAPLTVLGLGFGVRIMAADIDRRTLEIAYTVPGGAHRVWLAKLAAASLMLLAAEALLAVATYFFCTSYEIGALYGAMQGALVYMALAMGLSAMVKSEATGALLAVSLLVLNSFFQALQLRISPFFNPASLGDHTPAEVLAWTVQNRIGFVLITAAIVLLSFGRAERREKMLGG